jgi:L-cysteine S-thiosulfotransferase
MNTAVARLAVCLACCICAFHAHAEPASPERGRALLLQRQDTGCILCHQIPGLPVGGELGPSLHGLAQRSTPAQMRERIADARRFNPQTIMPAYLSTEGLHNVAKPYRRQTVLTPAALDDIVSYLFQPITTAP